MWKYTFYFIGRLRFLSLGDSEMEKNVYPYKKKFQFCAVQYEKLRLKTPQSVQVFVE